MLYFYAFTLNNVIQKEFCNERVYDNSTDLHVFVSWNCTLGSLRLFIKGEYEFRNLPEKISKTD